jgi:glucose/arabinose dehydrogenase
MRNRPRQQGAAPTFTTTLEPVATGLSSPVFVTNPHDGTNRLFIVERAGVIKVLQPGSTTPTVFLDISSRVLSGGERGLLGLAFHPLYRTNRRFFVYYTKPGVGPDNGALQIAEYHVSASDPNIADGTEIAILTIQHPTNANHNGGMVDFGSDGYLYIGTGDGGASNDPPDNAQNINSLLGKMLRIDIDQPNGNVPYSSPPDNPFFGATPGLDEIYAYGLRNPWRYSLDRSTGQLYVGDVGQGAWEEIDIVTNGGNYGWRVMEGNHCNPNLNGGVCTPIGAAPIAEYSHTAGRCSITGGYVYRGVMSTLPAGAYVYGDYCTGEIFLLQGGMQSLLVDTALNISSFGEDEAKELYVVGLGGTVQRIGIQAGPGGIDTVGLFDPTASQFFLRNANTSAVADLTFYYGPAGAGWTPLVGDWNGNGVDTVALYNPATSFFYLKNTHASGVASDLKFGFGPAGAGWIPIAGDWTGDGTDTIGLYNPTTSQFFLSNSNSSAPASLVFNYGPAGAGCIPIAGDWNGDGIDTIGLYDPGTSTCFLSNSNSSAPADLVFSYGPAGAGWKPVAGDWNGDGADTIGLFDPASSTFFLRNTNSSAPADLVFSYGPAGAGWTPIVGDWDGL